MLVLFPSVSVREREFLNRLTGQGRFVNPQIDRLNQAQVSGNLVAD